MQLLHEKRVLHLDIKPSNIVFRTGVSHPRIIDFGSSIQIPDLFEGEDMVIAVEPRDSVFTSPELSVDTKENAFYYLGVIILEFCIDHEALNSLKREKGPE